MNLEQSGMESLAWTKLFPFAMLRLGGLPVSVLKAFRSSNLEEAVNAVLTATLEVHTCHALLLEALDKALQDTSEGSLRTLLYNARKRLFKNKSVLWEPILFELNTIKIGWKVHFETCIHDFEKAKSNYKEQLLTFEKCYAIELQNAFEILPKVMDENFLKGLCSSSQSLTKRALSSDKKKLLSSRKKDRQTALALWQNIARVNTKTSPRGTWGPISVLDLEGRGNSLIQEGKSLVSPNVALLDLIYSLLSEHSDFHLLHPIRLNPSLEKSADGNFRFLDYSSGQEQVQVLEQDEILDFLFETIQEPMLYKRVAKRIVKITGIPKLECMHYVQQLIDFGFFIWEKPVLGLSADWAEKLASHMTTLPENSAHTSAIDFLNFLNEQAEILGNVNPSKRLMIQQSGQQKLQKFAEFFDIYLEGLSAEALWYEDCLKRTDVEVDSKELKKIIDALGVEIQSLWRFPLSRRHKKAIHFFRKKYAETDELSALEFLHHLIETEKKGELEEAKEGKGVEVESAPLGAVIQLFKNELNTYQAVLNGLHIGGGKLMNRFMPTCSDSMQKTMVAWLRLDTEVCWTEMAWHSTFNANFRPSLEACVLDIPSGKKGPNTTEQIPLSELVFRLNPKHKDHLELVWKKTGMVVRFLDTTPEAPNGLPPIIQYLRALGMPYFSKQIFEEKYPVKFEKTNSGWLHAQRQYLDEGKLIVLRRATWLVPVSSLKNNLGGDFFLRIRTLFKGNNLPSQVFFKVPNTKPQFLDILNPLSVLFFEKYLKKNEGDIQFEECLPIPESSIFKSGEDSTVGEIAIEWRL